VTKLQTLQGSTDLELAKAVLLRDRKAVAEFVQLCSDPVYRYVRFRLQPRMEAVEDLVQEVFLTAWKSLGRYEGEAPLRAWMLGIARHKVQDHYRRVLRDAPFPEEAEDPRVPAETVVIEAQAGERVQQVLQMLPEDYRAVLLWRYWEKRGAEEIAVEIGRTAKAVERLLARARQKFREEWERKEEGDERRI
jgi:RNA polymerase sigma-70 factor, ECF subfamily